MQLTPLGAGLPAAGLVLDILDEDAKGFYDKFDFFYELADDPMRLFIPMGVCRPEECKNYFLAAGYGLG